MSQNHEALFYTVKDMCEIIPTSRTNLYRMINSGVLQQPKRLTPRLVVWYRADIQDWANNYSQLDSATRSDSRKNTIRNIKGDHE
jgi:predicted DNA-binding transcriptional regulator AlpA